MNRRILIIVAFLIPIMATADDAETFSSQERLQVLYRQIEDQDAVLDKVYIEQKKFKAELARLNDQLNKLRNDENKLKLQLEEDFKVWQEINAHIADLEIEIQSIKSRSLKRLRALYISQNNRAHARLFRASTQSNISELLFLLGRVENFDRDLLVRLKYLSEDQRKTEEKYELLIKAQKQLKSEIVSKAEDVNKTIEQKASTAKTLGNQQKEIESLLTKLKANALRIETVVASLTQSTETKPASSSNYRRQAELQDDSVIEDEKFTGTGLKKDKRFSVLPVRGKTIRRYGKSKHEAFRDFVFNKGILVAANPLSLVKAIAKGRVVYVGRLPGYGNMIILDHGKHMHSLYARLDSTRVRIKQVVEPSEVIGLTGPVGNDGGSFYFEIRSEGKPVDPAKYIGPSL